MLEDESQSLSLPEIEQLLSTVVEKKQCLEEQEKEFNYGLVQRFMERAMYASHLPASILAPFSPLASLETD